MTTLGHFADYDRYLRLLTDAMRYKLRLNAHKGDIGDVPMERLRQLLLDELKELDDAVARDSEIEIILETADLCNFALGYLIAAVRNMGKHDDGVRTGVSGTVLHQPMADYAPDKRTVRG